MTVTNLFLIQFFCPLFISISLYLSPLNKKQVRLLALVGSIGCFLSTLALVKSVGDLSQITYLYNLTFKNFFGISYRFFIDGVSATLLILNALLVFLVVVSTWSFDDKKLKLYFFNIFLIVWAVNGSLLSENLYSFFIFWEAMLIPLFILIGVFGGTNRRYASLKFFLYTAVGSILMFSAIIYLSYLAHKSFNSYDLTPQIIRDLNLPMAGFFSPQSLVFWAFCIAFFIKVPLFPLHSWLPQAHVEAPTAGSIILAGILLKVGVYGLLRFVLPLYPLAAEEYRIIIMALGAAGVIFGSLVALAQTDIKKIVAFSSIAHMGLIVSGVFSMNPTAQQGALFQMIGHGLTTGGLFIAVHCLYTRFHTKELSAFGGLAKSMPIFAVCFFIIVLGSMAVPLTNGFVGEFMLLFGVYKTQKIIGIVSALGVILGPLYLLKLYQVTMLGAAKKHEHEVKDLSLTELIPFIVLIVLIIFYGVYPKALLNLFESSLSSLLKI